MADIMRNYNSRQQQKRGENSDTSLQKKKTIASILLRYYDLYLEILLELNA